MELELAPESQEDLLAIEAVSDLPQMHAHGRGGTLDTQEIQPKLGWGGHFFKTPAIEPPPPALWEGGGWGGSP